MMRAGHAIGLLAAALVAVTDKPAAGQVLDAVYRGTLVCDKLPFTEAKMRDAIRVTISGGAVSYSHVVRLRDPAEALAEKGTGRLDGRAITLHGSWDGGSRKYEATYNGTFVRRSAKLAGTQTWTDGGKTITRNCTGAIKRPLKAFLPRNKSPAKP